jgi:hypothetical protein
MVAAVHPTVVFKYKLPRGLRGFRYVKNHHYLELEDEKGNELHLPAHGVMRHYCSGCKNRWWTESNVCNFCPSCGGTDVEKSWGRLQVAFVPERESEFAAPEDLLSGSTGDLPVEFVEEGEDTDPAIVRSTVPKAEDAPTNPSRPAEGEPGDLDKSDDD